MDYEEDVAAEMRAGETLGKGRSRPTAGRNNVKENDFDIIDSQGIIIGTMTVREETDTDFPFNVRRTVTRSDK